MTESSAMATISNYPQNPVEMFKQLLDRMENQLITMNLATVDSDLGVLNRTVVYRGLIDDAVVFVTEKHTRKYQNLNTDARVSLTFLFPEVPSAQPNGPVELWQVRLINAIAFLLDEEQIAKLWEEESVHAKIRSIICECGKPVDHEQLKEQHDQLLKDYKNGLSQLERPVTYTAFKVDAEIWDFYMTEENKIADRVQYRKVDSAGEWQPMHVAA